MDRGAWRAAVHRAAQSDTTEANKQQQQQQHKPILLLSLWIHLLPFLHCPRKMTYTVCITRAYMVSSFQLSLENGKKWQDI